MDRQYYPEERGGGEGVKGWMSSWKSQSKMGHERIECPEVQ